MTPEQALYEEFNDFKQFFINSNNAHLDNEEQQITLLTEIRDVVREANKPMGEKEDPAKKGTSVSGIFSEINESFKKEFKEMANEFEGFFKKLIPLKVAPTKKFTTFLTDFMKAITMDGEFTDPKELKKLYEAIGVSFAYMGKSITPLSKGLILFSIASKTKGPELFIKFTQKMFSPENLKKIDTKKALRYSLAIGAIGKGMFQFGLYMALAGPLLLIGIPVALIAIPIMVGLLALFGLISKFSKTINKGAKAVKHLALGLLFFAGALALITFMPDIDFVKVFTVIGIFLLFTVAITLISKLGGRSGLKKVSRAVVLLAVGMLAFAGAIYFIGMLKEESIEKAAMVIGIVALALLILSLNRSGVMFAALGILIVAGSMLLLAYTVEKFGKLKPDAIMKFGIVIGIIAVALLIMSNPYVLIGALAFAIVAFSISIGLWLIFSSFNNMVDALEKFKKLGWTAAHTKSLAGVFTGLIEGVLAPFQSKNPFELIGKIYAGVAGIAMTTIIALVIGEIVDTLIKFKKSKVTKDDAKALGAVISETIKGVISPFKSEGNFFEKAFKTVGKVIAGGYGTAMLLGIGLVINRIVGGLIKFQKSDVTVKDAEDMAAVIAATVSGVITPFKGGGLMSTLKKMFTGIAGAGMLGGIGLGIDNIIDALIKFKDKNLKEVDSNLLGTIISGTVSGVITPFEGGGLVGTLKKMYTGIEGTALVTILSLSISELVQTLHEFKEYGLTETDADLLGSVISGTIKGVIDPFKDNNVFHYAGKMYAGIEGTGIVSILSMSIGHLVETLHKFKTYGLKPGDAKLLGEIVSGVVSSVINPFAEGSNWEWFKKVLGAETGADMFASMGTVIESVMNALKIFKDSEMDTTVADDMATTISAVITKLNTIEDPLNTLNYTAYNRKLGMFTKLATSYSKIGDSSEGINSAAIGVKSITDSTIRLFKAMDDSTMDKLDSTQKLFESLVDLDDLSSRHFLKKIDAVESLIDKTNEISENTGSLTDLVKSVTPERKEDPQLARMITLLGDMVNKQDDLKTSMDRLNTFISTGVIRVEQE